MITFDRLKEANFDLRYRNYQLREELRRAIQASREIIREVRLRRLEERMPGVNRLTLEVTHTVLRDKGLL